MKLKLTNNAETTLAGAINETATTVLLAPGTGITFPTIAAGEFFPLTLVSNQGGTPRREILYVTARTADSCTVLRAQEGTIAGVFAAGDYAGCHLTAGCISTKADLDGAAFTGAVAAPSITAAAATLGPTAITGATSIAGTVTMGDNPIKSAVMQDTSYAFKDIAAANMIDYRDGHIQRWTPGPGAQTLVLTNLPPAGTFWELIIEGVNLGTATITGPNVRWIKSDGSFNATTSFNANHGAVLQASGTDFIYLFGRDGGATTNGKVIR